MMMMPNMKVVFFAEDHQLIEPAFLELINSLLSGGAYVFDSS